MRAWDAALVACHSCDLVCHWPVGLAGHSRCPRCGAPLHPRKPNSLQRTWAFLLAAYVLYLPANLYPMTFTTYLGWVRSDTILSGVLYFLAYGDWPVALVIFIASLVVPLVKLLMLTLLLLSVHRQSRHRLMARSRWYRWVEIIGRWSMVDIFVLALMVALMTFGQLSTVEVGPAALPFAAVVILTMLASRAFDPRLLWDCVEDSRDRL
ncbi:MAG: paraquat-inducible protein A [Pseudomonadota bacterium]